ncbi:MAG: transporter substrate-binding domain-containing protein [Tissierellia bacterium]|mgnify:CR=1 FL=1|nr:transporter substrate-binding domain-containing protein [Bacillota bacterium]NLL23619.1 transporter substrate-binding domain-containing protein [Tissierellia bacterium]
MFSNKNFRKIFISLLIFSFFLLIAVTVFASWSNGISWYDYLRYSGSLSAEERRYLEDHPIRLASDITAPPISYFDEEKGSYDGLIVDYMNALSIELESSIEISMYPFYDLVEALRAGKVDAVDMFPSASRAAEFDLTLPMYKLKTLLIYPSGIEGSFRTNLAGKKIVVPKGDLANEFVAGLYAGTDLDPPELITVNSTHAVFETLLEGGAQIGIGDEAVIYSFWKEFDEVSGGKYRLETLYEKDVVFGIKKGNPLLLSILNKGILQLKRKEILDKAQQKWFGLSQSIQGEKPPVDLIVAGVIGIIIISIASYLWNYSLKQRVEETTADLLSMQSNLRQIMDHLGTALIICDEDGLIVESNTTTSRLLDQPKAVYLGAHYRSFEPLRALLSSAWEEEESTGKVEHRGKKFSVTKRLFFQEQQWRNLFIIEDIGERELLEERLRQESKMIAIGQLSAGFAHEIRNPLGIIRNGLFLLKKKEQGSIIDLMEESMNRINSLISHMLDISRVNHDEMRSTDVVDLIDSLLLLYESPIKSLGIEVDFHCSQIRQWPFYVESLKTIFLNLLDNSIDALEKVDRKRILKINCASDERGYSFMIHDNGVGIPADSIEYIFHPFYTSKPENSGTGLGLYVAYNEAKNLGGDLRVESVDGEGTRFILKIEKRQ